jgi:hypothetical protein
MNKTNKGLVEHVKMALDEKWGYVWGTFGDVLTENLFKEKLKQYPKGVGAYKDFIQENWLNRRTADCVGLIKAYMWWDIDYDEPEYNPATDVGADGMFAMANEKGTISSLPIRDMPGLCLYKDGHVGVYIGNGQVIEAHGTQYGVIQTPLQGEGATDWTHWFKCSFIKYEEVAVVEEKTYIEIIQEVSDKSATQWIKGIALAEAMTKEDGNLGDLEIFRFLPLLIEKIYRKYNV